MRSHSGDGRCGDVQLQFMDHRNCWTTNGGHGRLLVQLFIITILWSSMETYIHTRSMRVQHLWHDRTSVFQWQSERPNVMWPFANAFLSKKSNTSCWPMTNIWGNDLFYYIFPSLFCCRLHRRCEEKTLFIFEIVQRAVHSLVPRSWLSQFDVIFNYYLLDKCVR